MGVISAIAVIVPRRALRRSPRGPPDRRIQLSSNRHAILGGERFAAPAAATGRGTGPSAATQCDSRALPVSRRRHT
jgi:hypothetical protein